MNEENAVNPIDEVVMLPCPFCGSDADIWEEDKGIDALDEVWMVGCTECPCEMEGARNSKPSKHFPDEKEKIIKAWNLRAT